MDEKERRDKWRSVALVSEQRPLQSSINVTVTLTPTYWFLVKKKVDFRSNVCVLKSKQSKEPDATDRDPTFPRKVVQQ